MTKLERLWQVTGIGLGLTKPVFCDLDNDNDNEIEVITENMFGDIILVSGEIGKIKKRNNLVKTRIRDLVISDANNDGNLGLAIATESPNLIVVNSGLDQIYYNVSLPSIPLKLYPMI